MKYFNNISHGKLRYGYLIFTILLSFIVTTNAVSQKESYLEYSGKVVDKDTGSPLIFATISIEETNIATVTNSEGEFRLKVPIDKTDLNILVSFIGHMNKIIPISELTKKRNKIRLKVHSVSLAEINVFPKDAELLIRAVINRRRENYMQSASLMTAFYRETIKKRRAYASLSEAVVQIYKQPYRNINSDHIKLLKTRKSADYSKLDTLVLKLMGGPFNTLILDIMKNPNMIISYETIDEYTFTLDNITKIDNRLIYVLSFKQKEWIQEPLFYGKLYIDSESLAITRASFNTNTAFKEQVSRMFIKKKPAGAKVYITNASYMVSYREKDGEWYYGYSRGELTFKIDWSKKLFNTIYTAQFELAVTDWEKAEPKSPIKPKDRMRMNVIMRDKSSGFSDKNFWGAYNVIEPEKPIENAIKKIQKNLDKIGE
jgi:hypothetical protein